MSKNPKAAPEMDDSNEKSRFPHPLRVFLCHSSQDKPAVRELYHRLRDEGLEPWLDEENLLPGQNWQEEIPKAVQSSDAVIVFLSNNSVSKAGYVQKEIKYALDIADEQPEGAIFIIPLRLEKCEVPNRLRHLHYVDWFDEAGYKRLKRALQKRIKELQESDKTLNRSSEPAYSPSIPSKRPPTETASPSQTRIPQQTSHPLKRNLMASFRDPIWQMIGALVAIIALVWSVYANKDVPDSATVSGILTQTAEIVAIASTHTNTPMPEPTPKLATQPLPTHTETPTPPAPTSTSPSTPMSTPTAAPTNAPILEIPTSTATSEPILPIDTPTTLPPTFTSTATTTFAPPPTSTSTPSPAPTLTATRTPMPLSTYPPLTSHLPCLVVIGHLRSEIDRDILFGCLAASGNPKLTWRQDSNNGQIKGFDFVIQNAVGENVYMAAIDTEISNAKVLSYTGTVSGRNFATYTQSVINEYNPSGQLTGATVTKTYPGSGETHIMELTPCGPTERWSGYKIRIVEGNHQGEEYTVKDCSL